MRTLYPPIEPYDSGMLEVSPVHTLYYEQSGNPEGTPVVFLHGGPGSGSQHSHRLLFDPARFHAVLFDQRGAGRSHPYLSTHANTTQHLVADIERIRMHFGFEKMLIVGGSWGSTLALAYAETYPERVSGLVLRAVFLGSDAEVDWAFRRGARELRPDLYENFVMALPEAERALFAVMTARLEDFPTIDSFLSKDDFSAELLLSEIVYGMPHTMLGQAKLGFECRCSEAALLGAIATLGRSEIESLVAEKESLEIECDYCHKEYSIAPDRLRALLEAS